jgi:pimeloyl-ACP methyl ester carboxylesterase
MPNSPPEIRFCSGFDGARIAYSVSGKGLPLVRASTWLSHLELDCTNAIWAPWLDELNSHFRLIRYDQRGCGLSDRDIKDISLDAWVADLEAVVDAAGLEQFVLFGMSQGGPIAAAYAARHPDRVGALILLGAYAQGRMKRPEAQAQREESQTLIKLIEVGWGSETPAFRQVFTTFFMPDASADEVRAFDELQRMSSSPQMAARIVEAFDYVDVCEVLPQIRCPALVFHSTHDARIPFEQGRLMASLIPGARFIPLESRNHVLVKGEPAWREFMDQSAAFARDAVGQPAADAARSSELNAREAAIAELVAQGLDNHQIAAHMGLSEKTVRNRVSELLGTLQVESRARAIVVLREGGYGRN